MAEMMAIWAVYIKISWLCYIKNSNVNQLDMNFACFSVGLFALFTITRIRYIDARHDKIFPFVSSSHIKFILPSQRASKHALTSYWLQFFCVVIFWVMRNKQKLREALAELRENFLGKHPRLCSKMHIKCLCWNGDDKYYKYAFFMLKHPHVWIFTSNPSIIPFTLQLVT